MWQSINPSVHHFFNQDHLYTSFPLYIYINCLPLIFDLAKSLLQEFKCLHVFPRLTLRSLIDGVCGTVGVVGKNIKKNSRDGWNSSGGGEGVGKN